jgi:hypothetical protein
MSEIFVYGEIRWLGNFSWLWWAYDVMKLFMMLTLDYFDDFVRRCTLLS